MRFPRWHRKQDDQLQEEVQGHLDMAVRDRMERGETRARAEAAARREFGNLLLVREVTREMWGWASLERLWQDVRYGIRLLRKSPGFSAVAILTLALGIGANTALFSVVNGVLLNPLPYAQSDRLVSIYESVKNFEKASLSYLNFLDYQDQNRTLEAIAAYRSGDFILTGSGGAQRMRPAMVTADFFRVLGVPPIAGRDFTREEDRLGVTHVVILGEEFWKQKFGGSESIIGKSIDLNGKPYVVIGVMPSNFELTPEFPNLTHRDIYTLMGQYDAPYFRHRSAMSGSKGIGRLRPGVTVAQARADFSAIAAKLAAIYPTDNKGVGINLQSLQEDQVGDVRPVLLILLGAVGFVLLIACGNVANLLLARSTGRKREIAVRAALGASGTRIVRQLLTESVLLAMTGGALGVFLAAVGTYAAKNLLPPRTLPHAGQIVLDGQVLVFNFVIACFAGIVFGLIPALKAVNPDLHSTLKESGRGNSGSRHGAQAVFVVLETAMALVLLTGAGLMIRSMVSLWRVDPGFDPHKVVLFGIGLPPTTDFSNPSAVRATVRAVDQAIGQVSGISSHGLSNGAVPFAGDDGESFWLQGEAKPTNADDFHWAQIYVVQPGYFPALRIPMLRGRALTEQDNETAPKVVVVDETLAEKYFPHQDPIGQHLNFLNESKGVEIVGVAGHVKQFGLEQDSAPRTMRAEVYLPLMQTRDNSMSALSQLDVLARGSLPPKVLEEQVRRAVQQVNHDCVVFGAESMDSVIADGLAMRRFSMILLATFAALALLLASIGIYGVVSYVVGQRSHEIGIRMALGAQRSNVLRMVMAEGGRMALLGIGIGVGAALALTRMMTGMLFGVKATDPSTFAAVAVVLCVIALLACFIPARRAMQVDPMKALRYE